MGNRKGTQASAAVATDLSETPRFDAEKVGCGMLKFRSCIDILFCALGWWCSNVFDTVPKTLTPDAISFLVSSRPAIGLFTGKVRAFARLARAHCQRGLCTQLLRLREQLRGQQLELLGGNPAYGFA